MIKKIKGAFNSFVQLFYPRVCAGCGNNLLTGEEFICLNCYDVLQPTSFNLHKENRFYNNMVARIPIEEASAMYYFSKGGRIQRILHEIKYSGNKSLAVYMGNLIGKKNVREDAFKDIDVIVPVPLHPKKEAKRGYNQCVLICKGIGEAMDKPMVVDGLKRVIFTSTQTHKTRVDRWENVKDAFQVDNVNSLKGKHILLFDDVMTTGATLEASARTLLQIEGVKLSLATMVFTDEL